MPLHVLVSLPFKVVFGDGGVVEEALPRHDPLVPWCHTTHHGELDAPSGCWGHISSLITLHVWTVNHHQFIASTNPSYLIKAQARHGLPRGKTSDINNVATPRITFRPKTSLVHTDTTTSTRLPSQIDRQDTPLHNHSL